MDSTYTENVQKYLPWMNQRLCSMRCKHVMNLDTQKAMRLYHASNANGYPQVMWGYGSGIYKDEDQNRTIQLQTVRRMVYKTFTRPFRVVIDGRGCWWVDNLHSAIRDIVVFGDNLLLKDTRFYIVDLSSPNNTVVVNYNNSLSRDITDIMGAIGSSRKRDKRANGEICKINYTISEFMRDNDISKESVNLDERFYDAYIRKFNSEVVAS